MDFARLKKHLNDEYAPSYDRWRKRNGYFHRDILRFFRYAVPAHSRVLGIGFDDGWLIDSLSPQRGVYLGLSDALNRQGTVRYPHLQFINDETPDRLPLDETFYSIIFL